MDDGRVSAQFLEEVSHRLRSPLTSLITYLSLMEMRFEKAAREGGGREDLRGFAQLEAAALADALHIGDELDSLLARRMMPSVPTSPSTGAPKEENVGDRRFDRHWDAWDARLASGEQRLDVLKGLTERELAELLAADAGAGRKLERNVVATELTNRLARRNRPSSDLLVAAMARVIAHASHTSSDTRRLVAECVRTRAAGARRRAQRDVGRHGQEDGQRA